MSDDEAVPPRRPSLGNAGGSGPQPLRALSDDEGSLVAVPRGAHYKRKGPLVAVPRGEACKSKRAAAVPGPLPGKRGFVEVCSGSETFTSVWRDAGHAVFPMDLKKRWSEPRHRDRRWCAACLRRSGPPHARRRFFASGSLRPSLFHVFLCATAADSISRSPTGAPKGPAHGGPESLAKIRQQSDGDRLQTHGRAGCRWRSPLLRAACQLLDVEGPGVPVVGIAVGCATGGGGHVSIRPPLHKADGDLGRPERSDGRALEDMYFAPDRMW